MIGSAVEQVRFMAVVNVGCPKKTHYPEPGFFGGSDAGRTVFHHNNINGVELKLPHGVFEHVGMWFGAFDMFGGENMSVKRIMQANVLQTTFYVAHAAVRYHAFGYLQVAKNSGHSVDSAQVALKTFDM